MEALFKCAAIVHWWCRVIGLQVPTFLDGNNQLKKGIKLYTDCIFRLSRPLSQLPTFYGISNRIMENSTDFSSSLMMVKYYCGDVLKRLVPMTIQSMREGSACRCVRVSSRSGGVSRGAGNKSPG